MPEPPLSGLARGESFGQARLEFAGPDGDSLALVEDDPRGRSPWAGGGIGADVGILGFRGARFRLRDAAATGELLAFMGYERAETAGNVTRWQVPGGNAADVIDIEELPGARVASQGAGSVHHIAFAVEDRAVQAEVQRALMDTGYQVTPVIDRDYFYAIYFRAPGGILFEIATNEPGFDRDEDTVHLGQALKLPSRYEPLRDRIEALLPPITD